jgi:hypothetical protein
MAVIALTPPGAGAQAPHAASGGVHRTPQTAPGIVSRSVSEPADAPTRRTDSSPAANSRGGAQQHAPDDPPLSGAQTAGTEAGDEADASAPAAEVDPLVANGLSSPMCRGAPGGAQLSPARRSDCETSGFVAAAAPTGDYGIDVHIDAGVPGVSTGWLLSVVQQLFVTPVWTALVWAVHALVVMLEWCFTIDLLDSPSVGVGLARSLRQVQATFTQPWLATVLSIGAVLAAYNGLVRRRVAETLGHVLLVLAMMAGGLWVTLDPAGTVGAIGAWANQAGLGTLAVTATGTPARAGEALADSMGTVFSAAVEVPWCYLEFGDVGWCRNPTRLDPRLRAAAQSIAAGELVFARCEHGTAALGLCSAPGSPQVEALEHSARLLRAAHSNGEIFLALPANGAQRNAINDHESLLWAICQSGKATACRGDAAAQAEFRTDRGTWPRVAGLLLIVVGALGLLLLLGFLAMRLLASAVISLLYLMLAPAAVLAPALGDGGRALFRKWATQLLAAVVSKLLFSFLLGAILAVLAVLDKLEGLGWWTQWLLMSAFWWGAFIHRHRALQAAVGVAGGAQVRERRTIARRAGDAVEAPRKLVGGVRAVRRRHEQQRAAREMIAEHRKASPTGPPRPPHLTGASVRRGRDRSDTQLRPPVGEQARRTLLADYRDARAQVDSRAAAEQRLLAMDAQLTRVREQQRSASTAPDGRRAARLAHRAARVESEAERVRGELTGAQRTVAGRRRKRKPDVAFSAEQAQDRDRFLDAQAALAPSARRRGELDGERRDYRALAGLAGYGPREYERLPAPDRRAARLRIDRELRSRTVGRSGEGLPIPRQTRPRRHDPLVGSESSVMADIREVAARRKRQLGRGRP